MRPRSHNTVHTLTGHCLTLWASSSWPVQFQTWIHSSLGTLVVPGSWEVIILGQTQHGHAILIAHCGPEVLDSHDPPTWASHIPGIPGAGHHAQLTTSCSVAMLVSCFLQEFDLAGEALPHPDQSYQQLFTLLQGFGSYMWATERSPHVIVQLWPTI